MGCFETKIFDYHIQCRRLHSHCERIFQKSGMTAFTTIRKAAKALRMLQSEVLEMAEDLHDQGYLIINVAHGVQGMGCYKLSKADWELEPLEVSFDE